MNNTECPLTPRLCWRQEGDPQRRTHTRQKCLPCRDLSSAGLGAMTSLSEEPQNIPWGTVHRARNTSLVIWLILDWRTCAWSSYNEGGDGYLTEKIYKARRNGCLLCGATYWPPVLHMFGDYGIKEILSHGSVSRVATFCSSGGDGHLGEVERLPQRLVLRVLTNLHFYLYLKDIG